MILVINGDDEFEKTKKMSLVNGKYEFEPKKISH